MDPAENGISAADDPATLEVEEMKSDTGGELIMNYDLLLMENTKFVSEAKLFAASGGGANLRWDNNLYLKLQKYLTIQLGYLAVYNHNDTLNTSFPEDMETKMLLALGISYNLF